VDVLDYLHNELKIAHRDIKLDNILMQDNLDLKLADYGSCTSSEDDISACKEFRGTLSYMAPEVRSGLYDARKADLFSLG
jgi:serine/threonine protein kinase